jgi:hypothetical protein
LPPSEPAERDLVFVVEGVGGFDIFAPSVHWALNHSGLPHEFRHFVWTHGWGHILKDLQDSPHLALEAEALAAEVSRAKTTFPLRRIYLIGKSGGAALVLGAAEKLPPATLERIILLSAAVSPIYDLRGALRATSREIISFYSDHDQIVLGYGTRKFGTADRAFSASAGLHGFLVPRDLSAADQNLYRRLIQVPWTPSMMTEGNFGGHAGTNSPFFLRKEVTPWLLP